MPSWPDARSTRAATASCALPPASRTIHPTGPRKPGRPGEPAPERRRPTCRTHSTQSAPQAGQLTRTEVLAATTSVASASRSRCPTRSRCGLPCPPGHHGGPGRRGAPHEGSGCGVPLGARRSAPRWPIRPRHQLLIWSSETSACPPPNVLLVAAVIYIRLSAACLPIPAFAIVAQVGRIVGSSCSPSEEDQFVG